VILNISLPYLSGKSVDLYGKIHDLDNGRHKDILETLLPLQKCPFKLMPLTNTQGNLKYFRKPYFIGEIDSFLDYV
jgi:hypothetical protein